MNAIIQKIDGRIGSWNKGRIFFGNDFADLATSDAIRQSLGRLAKEGKILPHSWWNLLLSSEIESNVGKRNSYVIAG